MLFIFLLPLLLSQIAFARQLSQQEKFLLELDILKSDITATDKLLQKTRHARYTFDVYEHNRFAKKEHDKISSLFLDDVKSRDAVDVSQPPEDGYSCQYHRCKSECFIDMGVVKNVENYMFDPVERLVKEPLVSACMLIAIRVYPSKVCKEYDFFDGPKKCKPNRSEHKKTTAHHDKLYDEPEPDVEQAFFDFTQLVHGFSLFTRAITLTSTTEKPTTTSSVAIQLKKSAIAKVKNGQNVADEAEEQAAVDAGSCKWWDLWCWIKQLISVIKKYWQIALAIVLIAALIALCYFCSPFFSVCASCLTCCCSFSEGLKLLSNCFGGLARCFSRSCSCLNSACSKTSYSQVSSV